MNKRDYLEEKAEIEHRIRGLNNVEKELFFSEFRKRLKDEDTYTTLAWFFGSLGIHRLYLGHYGRALLHLFCAPAGAIFIIVGLFVNIGLIFAGAILLLNDLFMWIADLIRYKSIMERHNLSIKLEILNSLGKCKFGSSQIERS